MKEKELRKKIIRDILACIGLVLLIYVWSLNRPWIFYDERVIYDEEIAPVFNSFSDIIEYLQTFGTNFTFTSGNPIYTSKEIQRSNLLGVPFFLIVEFLFKKNVFFYHLLNLIAHLTNTTLVYLILRRISHSSLITILFTAIWALHPAQAEAVLLTCNILPLLNYTVYFSLFLDFINNENKEASKIRFLLIPLIFLLPTVPNEHIFSLPLIILFYLLVTKKDLKSSILKSAPYFLGLFLYVGYFFITHLDPKASSITNSISLHVERIFWLSPQIFFHALKMIFFPKTLSIDQTALIRFGYALNDPYAIFCMIFLFLWLVIPLILFLKDQKRFTPIFLFSWLPFIGFLPFSQILSPSYCLFAERYLYTPIFFTIFGILLLLPKNNKNTVFILLITILILFSCRTLVRINDWKNDCTLIQSCIKTNPNLLYKGLRTYDLAFKCSSSESEFANYLLKSAEYFESAIKNLEEEKIIHSKLPKIFESYGLDYDFLILKAIYYLSAKDIDLQINNEDFYLKSLQRVESYLSRINYFDSKLLEIYANLLVKVNKIDEAKKIFIYTYNKYPNATFILVSLIRLERDVYSNQIAAKEYLNKALILQPSSKEVLLEAMKCYQKENDLINYGKYSYLYGLRTNSKLAYQEALTVFLTINNLDLANKIVNKLTNLQNEDSTSLYLIASYYIKTKDFNQAIEILNRAYRSPSLSDTSLALKISSALSKLYEATGNNEQAKYFLNESLKFKN